MDELYEIEEMTKDLYEELKTENIPYHKCDYIAQKFIAMGWIKLNEDKVVISKEEYELLVECSSYENLENEYTKGSKETAEKCIRLIKKTYFTKEALCEFIARQFDVEIKEN